IAAIVYDVTRGSFVAPITLAVMEEYFEDQLTSQFPDYQRQFDYDSPVPATSSGAQEETSENSDENTDESSNEEENTP
ncbi:MAG TPA: hypothetical protein VLM88_12080, partial [Proteiniclasticum sp.]|nr:hypothetical protein [Proteiniclasticum sp.]